MTIQKKSLISSLNTTKRAIIATTPATTANVAKPALTAKLAKPALTAKLAKQFR